MKWQCARCLITHRVLQAYSSMTPRTRATRTRCAECRMPFFFSSQPTDKDYKTRLYVVEKEAWPWLEKDDPLPT